MSAAIAEVDRTFDATLATLEELTRIPGISAAAYPAGEVRRSAEAVADVLLQAGLTGVRLLGVEGEHPAVYAEAAASADAPTILVYGHHDVQPPGREEAWHSPPFEPEVRDGRLFGRGTSDDKGGFLAHVAAIRAGLASRSLPCNVKVLIEGEEEIGSPHLGALLERHRDLFACDTIVLCDTPNYAAGVPALTYRLRGNCLVDVEVRCLERPVHSGQGGGVVPDAIRILCVLIARLEPLSAVPGLYDRVRVDPALRELAIDEERFRRDKGLLDGVGFEGDASLTLPERLWGLPSLTVTAIEAVPIARAANQIVDSARARLSLRTVPDLDTVEAGRLLARALEADPPHGARVTAKVLGGPSWWEADPSHPLFAAARRALSRGFGAEAKMIGSGGSIGFVAPFASLAGSNPPLLTGVQDPASNAHSENESLDLGDWRKAMHAAVYLYEELRRFAP